MNIEHAGRYGGTNYALEAAHVAGMFRVIVGGRVVGRIGTYGANEWWWHYTGRPEHAAEGRRPNSEWAADEVVGAHLAALQVVA